MGDNPFEKIDVDSRGNSNYICLTDNGGVITEFANVHRYYQLDYAQETVLRAMFLGRAFHPDDEQQAVLKELFPNMAYSEITNNYDRDKVEIVEKDVVPFKYTEDMEALLKHIPANKIVDLATMLAEKDNSFGYEQFDDVKDDFVESGRSYISAYRLVDERAMNCSGDENEYSPVECLENYLTEDGDERIVQACANPDAFEAEKDIAVSKVPLIGNVEEATGDAADPVDIRKIEAKF